MTISAMKQALEALEEVQRYDKTSEWFEKKVSALRQAIAEAEKIVPSDYLDSHQQEPFAVAWVLDGELFWPSEYEVIAQAGDKAIPLYTAPREWVGLTDEEILKLWGSYFPRAMEFYQAIEAKLKEKNI